MDKIVYSYTQSPYIEAFISPLTALDVWNACTSGKKTKMSEKEFCFYIHLKTLEENSSLGVYLQNFPTSPKLIYWNGELFPGQIMQINFIYPEGFKIYKWVVLEKNGIFISITPEGRGHGTLKDWVDFYKAGSVDIEIYRLDLPIKSIF